MSDPVFSVLMPVHNGAPWLQRTLAALYAQSFADWELLAVDDGSRDDSFDQLSGSGDPRVHVTRLAQASGGPALPRNVALRQARGAFVCLLDQDDEWMPDKLGSQWEKLRSGDWDLVYSDAVVQAQDGTYLYSERWGPQCEGEVGRQLVERCFVPALTVAFTRDAARRTGAFRTGLVGVDDYDYWLRLAAAGGRFGLVDRPLATWHLHEHNLSHSVCATRAIRVALQQHRTDPQLGTAVRARLRDLRREERDAALRSLRAKPDLRSLVTAVVSCRSPYDARLLRRALRAMSSQDRTT